MKRIRLGKDISMRWEITTDGVAMPLEGRDLTVEIKSPIGKVSGIPYRVDGNVIIMTYYGYEQKWIGEYSITLWENKGKPGQNVVDAIRAFKLVRASQEEDDFMGGDLQMERVDLGNENFDILTEGGYRAINIDTLQAEAHEDSVNISGKTYSNEPFTITLPKANLDKAGVMGADDVRTLQEHGESIEQINATLEGHTEGIASNKTSCEENAAEIGRVSNVVDDHEGRLGNIDATLSGHAASINGINNALATHGTQIDKAAENIESTNSALSALQGKVDANTTSISQIEAELDNMESIAQINATLQEHTESIAQVNTTISSLANELSQIKDEQDEQNSDISQINNTQSLQASKISVLEAEVIEHSTEIATNVEAIGNLGASTDNKITSLGEALRLAIMEVKRSIPLIKAFVVETGSEVGFYRVDGVKVEIPANTRRSVNFKSDFNIGIIWNSNPGLTYVGTTFTDTSTIESANAMFFGCSSLTSLDLSSFDTSAVTRMSYMFYGCLSLTSLDLSSFDTSAVTQMVCMFMSCSSLTSLDLSSFDTSAVTNMTSAFDHCPSLTSILLGPSFFKTSEVTAINFSPCPKWTNETVATSLVTNSYDRAAAGLNTLTLQLHANTKAALTDEQKAAITSKGYTIA